MKTGFDSDDRDYDYPQRVAFWESARPWLKEHGYIMNRFIPLSDGYGQLAVPQFEYTGEVQHPYSLFDDDDDDDDDAGIRISGEKTDHSPCRHLSSYIDGRVVFAQDQQNHHVAIKLVKQKSHEYDILRRLHKESSLYSRDSFNCVIPPLDFLEFEQHCFVVMPRWGPVVLYPWFSTIREVMEFIHCLLKGLAFLHQNLICHRDIKSANVLVNHWGSDDSYRESETRRDLRYEGKLVYALFDFDMSIVYLPMSTPEQRRRPAWESFSVGTWAFDTCQGELDFDPFIFDVGALGMLFCWKFQKLTVHAPMLAPLLDMMIARDLKKRFTAVEALQFFEASYPSLSQEQLEIHPEGYDPTGPKPERYDRWAGLPEDLIHKWSDYRLPKLPWSTAILRYICRKRRSRPRVALGKLHNNMRIVGSGCILPDTLVNMFAK